MTIKSLFYAAAPSCAALYPAAGSGRFYRSIGIPRVTVRRMFEYASKLIDRSQGGLKASVIITKLELMRLARRAVPKAAPSARTAGEL